MKNQYNTTIAAISTAMSNSGIGIVRMSGSDSFEIADKIYKGKRDKKLSDQKSHTIHYGYIMDCEDTVDEVLVMLMRGPHSYTGEDTVEINCHGGVYIVKRILEILIKYGARPAVPGDFSKIPFILKSLYSFLSNTESKNNMNAAMQDSAKPISFVKVSAIIADAAQRVPAVPFSFCKMYTRSAPAKRKAMG